MAVSIPRKANNQNNTHKKKKAPQKKHKTHTQKKQIEPSWKLYGQTKRHNRPRNLGFKRGGINKKSTSYAGLGKPSQAQKLKGTEGNNYTEAVDAS